MENLGIDPKLLLAQVINFLLFFFIIKKFIVKPFNLFLDQEKKQDKDKEEALATIKKTEEEIVIKEQKLTEKAKKEMNLMLDQAKKDSEQVKSEMLKQAEIEAEGVKTKMKKQLEEERDSLYKELKEKIADVSMSVVTQSLSEALDETDKKKVTQRILKNLK
ncbi:MAG: ATP synthase F0 subunit B [bacterium]|nr:ATP synthase F0 subunit B [bacterium]